MGLLITQSILNRVPKWNTDEGWQVNETVDFGNYNNQCSAIGNEILTNDTFAAYMNNHPPHHP